MLVPSKTTEVSWEPPKAASPMDATLGGMMMELKIDPLNAEVPMDVTVDGIE